MSKDWTGNAPASFVTNGASNHSKKVREEHDFYATHPDAVRALLQCETFSNYVLEPACGAGHISEVLKSYNYNVVSKDLYDYGYPGTVIENFFDTTKCFGMDIVTNPPYKYASEFVEHALDISDDGTKIAMFLKLTFLETTKRRALFNKYPPKVVYIFSKRQICAKNGDFSNQGSSAVAYAWYIWEKGFKGNPIIKWI